MHALANVVSVEVEGGPPVERAAQALNTRLPDEVVDRLGGGRCRPSSARGSPRGRAATATASSTGACPSPFERRRSWWVAHRLDEEPLHAAAALLLGEHDFRAFTPTQTRHKVFVRTVERAEWIRRGDHLDFEITADSFLRYMVRTRRRDDARVGPGRDRAAPRRRGRAPRPGRRRRPGGSTSSAVDVLTERSIGIEIRRERGITSLFPRTRGGLVKKRTGRACSCSLVLGAAAAVLGLTASSGRHDADVRSACVREGSSAEQARERAAASSAAANATLGPHVGTGEFQGVVDRGRRPARRAGAGRDDARTRATTST